MEERDAGIKESERERVKRAIEILHRYKSSKETLNKRIQECEEWWKMNQWDLINAGKTDIERRDPEPKSAWMFNSIINKHADFMDNFPSPNILPREESDKETAKILSSVIPCILDQCEYEDAYSIECWDKLKFGGGIFGVFWDSRKNGIGDIEIKVCDLLNIFWEPGIEDIQKSPHVFYQSLQDNSSLEAMYPQLKGRLGSGTMAEYVEYIYDKNELKEEKSVVIDHYYKRTVDTKDENGIIHSKTILHFEKICNGEMLYATENDPEMENGLYAHGKYPFVFDVLFPVKGSPMGIGYIDVMKDTQLYIDKLGQSIIKNAVIGAKPRYLSKDGSGINENEFSDLTRDIVHYNGDIGGIQPIEHYPLDPIYLNVLNAKIDELKETSGNRDFSQGATTSGVTAASAIAALQEAGSKLSRDMIKTSYRACRDITYLVIELVREFYKVSRVFRITQPNGQEQFIQFDNRGMLEEQTEKEFGLYLGGRKPYFDVKISAQKSSPFTKIAQNELAKEMYNLGFFNPQLADQALMCIGMMDFDGKDEIERKIMENGTMYQQIQQMQQSMLQMAQVIAETTGDTRLVDAIGQQNPVQQVGFSRIQANKQNIGTDDFGNAAKEARNSTAGKARQRAAEAATPKV